VAIGISALGVAAQDRDTLWTRISAAGPILSLKWDKNHPWDADLTARGAMLIAKYWVEPRREVSEPVGRVAAGKPGARTFEFPLPEDVGANPIGPICLFFQLPDRRVLPIRRADKQDGDTAGFRYEAWERQVRQRGAARAAQARVAAAESALNVSTQSVANQQAAVSSRGWGTLDSCQNVSAPAADVGAQPYDVVPPRDHDDIARRVCVHRVWYGQRLFADLVEEDVKPLIARRDAKQGQQELRRLYGIAYAVPEAAGPLLAELKQVRGGQAVLAAREAQAAEFLRDWQRLSPTTASYKPHLSGLNYLQWPSTMHEAAFRIFAPDVMRQQQAEWLTDGVPKPTITEIEGVIGAALDAYSGCVEDGRKQLQIRYDNWQALSSSAPQRAAAARDFLVRECRQEVGLLDKLKAERAGIEEQLSRERELLKTASAPARPPAGQAQALNLAACSSQP
jgi:hypothetical protein